MEQTRLNFYKNFKFDIKKNKLFTPAYSDCLTTFEINESENPFKYNISLNMYYFNSNYTIKSNRLSKYKDLKTPKKLIFYKKLIFKENSTNFLLF
jgi:hypothetical protein